MNLGLPNNEVTEDVTAAAASTLVLPPSELPSLWDFDRVAQFSVSRGLPMMVISFLVGVVSTVLSMKVNGSYGDSINSEQQRNKKRKQGGMFLASESNLRPMSQTAPASADDDDEANSCCASDADSGIGSRTPPFANYINVMQPAYDSLPFESMGMPYATSPLLVFLAEALGQVRPTLSRLAGHIQESQVAILLCLPVCLYSLLRVQLSRSNQVGSRGCETTDACR